jgi:hypothetical protein
MVLGLFAAAGCNQIWGLSQVDLAPDDGPPAEPRVRLTLQLAQTTAEGFGDPTLAYPPLTPAPAVQLGLVGDALVDAPYKADGSVDYPLEFAGQRWRLVYTFDGAVPREVQWTLPASDASAHVVEPLVGRLEREDVPVNAGYSITPANAPMQYLQPRVFTTGLWTEGALPGTVSGGTLNYDFSTKAVSLSGRLGAPEKAKADRGVLASYQTLDTCRYASNVATFIVPDLVANMRTSPDMQPTYYVADKQVDLVTGGPVLIDFRLSTLLGTRAGGMILRRMQYGHSPSIGVSGFSRPPPAPSVDFHLPGPQIIALANCTVPVMNDTLHVPALAHPPDLAGKFPRIVHVEIANQRTHNLVTLSSGYSAVVASDGFTFESKFLVAGPFGTKLYRGADPIADLDADPDGTMLPAGDGPLELTFEVESLTTLASHYFDVTLYALQGAKLEKRRVYTLIDRKLTIDPAVLIRGTEYVFELRAYHGTPDAGRGNFALHTNPQYAASVFTRTFIAP